MPDSDFTKTSETYWTLRQTAAWIAWRDPDRGWSGLPPEIDEAYRKLAPLLESGKVRASRRMAKTGPRGPIEPVEWCDVILLWFENPRFIGQDEPRFYDRNTPDRDFADATAEPWRDVLFVVADVVKAFPIEPVTPAPALSATESGRRGGKKSGEVRRESRPWVPHAEELALAVAPNLSNEAIATEISGGWKRHDVDPPGIRTLQRFVAKLRGGKIPPRAKALTEGSKNS